MFQTVSLVLIAKHGQRYRCLIPDSQLDLNGLSDDNNGEQTTSNIPELLQPLADKCLVTVSNHYRNMSAFLNYGMGVKY